MAFNVITSIDLDMSHPNANIVNAVQYDSSGRIVKARLLNNGVEWAVPSGCYPVIRYQKSDRVGGFYDVDENNAYAISYENSRKTINLTLALQVLTTVGYVDVQVNFYDTSRNRVTTFAFRVRVQRSVVPDNQIVSSEYYNALSATLAAAISDIAIINAAASKLDRIYAALPELVSDWLDVNITNPTNPAIDKSLMVEGAAADSRETGVARFGLRDVQKSTYFPFDIRSYVQNGTFLRNGNGYPNDNFLTIGLVPMKKGMTLRLVEDGVSNYAHYFRSWSGFGSRSEETNIRYDTSPAYGSDEFRIDQDCQATILFQDLTNGRSDNPITPSSISHITIELICPIDLEDSSVIEGQNILAGNYTHTFYGYYNSQNVYTTADNFGQSDYIEVTPGDVYKLPCTSVFVNWYDASKSFVSSYASQDYNNTRGIVTVPSGVKYGKFVFHMDGLATEKLYCLNNLNARLRESYNFDANDWKNLTGVAFGTSLTARARSSSQGYLNYLQIYSGVPFENKGLGSGTILHYSDSQRTLPDILAEIEAYSNYANKDICIIEGFPNDWGYNSNLGTYKDTGRTTVCGCLRTAIDTIKSRNSKITIYVILSHFGSGVNGPDAILNGRTQYEFYEELAKVCEFRSIPVIKEYALCGINGYTSSLYLVDNIHLSPLGCRHSASVIWNQMKQFSVNRHN